MESEGDWAYFTSTKRIRAIKHRLVWVRI